MEEKVLKYEGLVAYVPFGRHVVPQDGAKLCQDLRVDALRWRLPTHEEVKHKIKTESKGSFWIEKDEHGYACASPNSYYRDITGDRAAPPGYIATCGVVCVASAAGARPAQAVSEATEKKTATRNDVTNQLLRFAPDPKKELETQAAARLQADRDYAKVRAAEEQQVAKKNAERQLVAFDRELKDRKQCALPHNQGSCNCGKYQAQPPGGRKTCDK
jgi:hypothetical protein